MKRGEDYTGVTIVYFCHDGAGNVLLNKRGKACRDEHGRWDCGAGGLDFGDTVEGTLRKEIREEYGTEVRAFEYLGYRDIHRENLGVRTHWVSLDFFVHVDRAQAKNGEPHKFDAVEWFPVQTLPKPLHSQFPHFILKYGERIGIRSL